MIQMSSDNIFEKAGRVFFSRDYIRMLEKDLNAAGINMPADSFAGFAALEIVVISIVLTLLFLVYQPVYGSISSFVLQFIPLDNSVILGAILALLVFLLSMMIVYLSTMALIATFLTMKTEDRRNKLETMLPDFLGLVSSNIKAGMTLDQAMWYSAKPEFGLLADETKSAIKGSFSGESLGVSLDHLATRFDSRTFRRTVLLLKQASATGGQLTDVLERTAEDVRNTNVVKKEIAATLVMYEIFVLFASVVGTPFLFAVAYKLVEIFEKIAPQAGGGLSGAAGTGAIGGVFAAVGSIKVSGGIISASDFLFFTIPTIFVTALISSFIVSVIRTGTRNQGMKYFPFVLVCSYLVYWVAVTVITALFSSFA